MNKYEEIKYSNLRMMAIKSKDNYVLEIAIASGFVDFMVDIEIEERDFKIIQENEYRAALLQAALHRPFQLQKTFLNKKEQRHYLNIILHGSEQEIEKFLTTLDNVSNGAISNMVRITCKRDQNKLRNVSWFY